MAKKKTVMAGIQVTRSDGTTVEVVVPLRAVKLMGKTIIALWPELDQRKAAVVATATVGWIQENFRDLRRLQ